MLSQVVSLTLMVSQLVDRCTLLNCEFDAEFGISAVRCALAGCEFDTELGISVGRSLYIPKL